LPAAADIAVNGAMPPERDGERAAECRLAFARCAYADARRAEAVCAPGWLAWWRGRPRCRGDLTISDAPTASTAGTGQPVMTGSRSMERARRRRLHFPWRNRPMRNSAWPTSRPKPGTRSASATIRRRAIKLTVNGIARRLLVADNDLLLNVLREDLELTGTKYGCGIGECSACTVLIDGSLALSCLVLAAAADGSHIRTVEGLAAPDGTLDPLQEAFLDYASLQCGFCTPGMLMTAVSLLEENPHPTEVDVRAQLRGNMCRCTGYAAIVRAVLAAAEAQAVAG
jgi:carbon-monoxide dehydrogenase small subunit